jgi:hypothetical protein
MLTKTTTQIACYANLNNTHYSVCVRVHAHAHILLQSDQLVQAQSYLGLSMLIIHVPWQMRKSFLIGTKTCSFAKLLYLIKQL